MSFFSKFKIGSTSYDVKDALAGKSLSISGSSLSLKDAAGNAVSTVNLPDSGGIVDIKINTTTNKWTNLAGSKNVFDMPVNTVVRYNANYAITNFYDLKLITADSPIQNNDSGTIAYTNLGPGGFIGVITAKITASSTTVVKRIDMDMQHFPTDTVVSNWMNNYQNLSGLDGWIKNRYSIVKEENLTSSNNLVVKSLDENTTYTKTAAAKYTLSNGLILIGIQLSEDPYEALKFSGSAITSANITVVGWRASPTATYGRATTNTDFTVSTPSGDIKNLILLYGHLL